MRRIWWPGVGILVCFLGGAAAGYGPWLVDSWRDWVAFSEAGYRSPGMDATSSLPAGTWILEWMASPFEIGAEPERVLFPGGMALAAIMLAGQLGPIASFALSAALILPPFFLFLQLGVAAAAALAWAAFAWVALDRQRAGAALAASVAAAAIYPAAIPVLVAAGIFMLVDPTAARRRMARAMAILAGFGIVAVAYLAAGNSPTNYSIAGAVGKVPAAMLHAVGGGIGAVALLAMLGWLALGQRRGFLALLLVVAWLVASLGIAMRHGPWTLLQPVFLLSGFAVPLLLRAGQRRPARIMVAMLMCWPVLTSLTGPERDWKPSTLLAQVTDRHLPGPLHEAVLKWRRFETLYHRAEQGQEPAGEFGLVARWAAEFERQSPVTSERVVVDSLLQIPWCPEMPCELATSKAEELSQGPVLLQVLTPRRVSSPMRLAFLPCAGGSPWMAGWDDVRVVDLWNALGVVLMSTLPEGCWIPSPILAAGEWQAIQCDQDGACIRVRGSGDSPYVPRRY